MQFEGDDDGLIGIALLRPVVGLAHIAVLASDRGNQRTYTTKMSSTPLSSITFDSECEGLTEAIWLASDNKTYHWKAASSFPQDPQNTTQEGPQTQKPAIIDFWRPSGGQSKKLEVHARRWYKVLFYENKTVFCILK